MTNNFMTMVANAVQTALKKKKEVEKGFQNGDFEFEYEMWTGYEDGYTLTYFEDDNTFYLENDMVEIIIWNDGQIEMRGLREFRNFRGEMRF